MRLCCFLDPLCFSSRRPPCFSLNSAFSDLVLKRIRDRFRIMKIEYFLLRISVNQILRIVWPLGYERPNTLRLRPHRKTEEPMSQNLGDCFGLTRLECLQQVSAINSFYSVDKCVTHEKFVNMINLFRQHAVSNINCIISYWGSKQLLESVCV